MSRFASHAVGERPGGYSRLRQKPYGLFGEPAWNSLGEYRRSRGVDSRLPPGMPSDVTRVDHSRPQDATLGYRSMPVGHAKEAAGFLGGMGAAARGAGWLLREGGPSFASEAYPVATMQSARRALGQHSLQLSDIPGLRTPGPSEIKALTSWGSRFFSRFGGNQRVANTPENRLAHYYQGHPEAEPLMRQSLAARSTDPGAAAGLEQEALRKLTGNPEAILRTRPERTSAGWSPPPPQGWGPQWLNVPRRDYRLGELAGWLGLGGIPTAYAGSKLFQSLKAPRAGMVSPPIATAPPSGGGGPTSVGNTSGGLGDMAASVGAHLNRNWLPYSAALGLGGGGLLLAHHLQRRREEDEKRRLEEALLSKSGSADLLASCPAAAGILAYCAEAGYGEAEIRHTLIKAAGVVPGFADEVEVLCAALEPMVKEAIGAGYPSGIDRPATPAVTPPTPAPHLPAQGQSPFPNMSGARAEMARPRPNLAAAAGEAGAGPVAGNLAAALPPVPTAPPTSNMARAYGAMRAPADQAAAAQWRQQVVAADRVGDAAGASRLRAARPVYNPQGTQAGIAQLQSEAQTHARGLITPQEQQHLEAMDQAGIRDPQERVLLQTPQGPAALTNDEMYRRGLGPEPMSGALPGMGMARGGLGMAGRGLGTAARWAWPAAKNVGSQIGMGLGLFGTMAGGQAAWDKMTRPGPQAAPQLSPQAAPIAAEMNRQVDAASAANGAKPGEIAAAKLQNQHMAATMSPEQQQAYAKEHNITLPRRYISEQGPQAFENIKTPEQLAEVQSNAVEGLDEILSKAKTEGGPNFDPNKAIPELTKPLTDLVHAAVRRGDNFAEDPEQMLKRMAGGDYTPTEARQIVNNLAGPQAPPEHKAQALDFLQNADGPTKALLGIGVPMAILGVLSSLLGEGGMGGLLMALLGGGAALYGASRAGILPDMGLGGILGGGAGTGTAAPAAGGGGAAAPPAVASPTANPSAPAAAAAPARGSPASPPVTPEMINEFMGMAPEARRARVQGLLRENPSLAPDVQKAYGAWTTEAPLVGGHPFRGEVARKLRERLGMPGLSDEQVAAFMDAYGGGGQ